MSIVVPWVRRREGPKVTIGDNLSSHLSASVLEKCGTNNIRFLLLTLKGANKCQPLGVTLSFLGPMKRERRKLMEEHKMKNPKSTSLAKLIFPCLLSKVIDGMGMRVPQNLVSGFRACGITPLNADAVLKKYPAAADAENQRRVAEVSPAVLEYLQQFWDISNSSGISAAILGYLQQFWDIPSSSGISAAILGYLQQFWNICTVLKYLQQFWNICSSSRIFQEFWNISNSSGISPAVLKYLQQFWNISNSSGISPEVLEYLQQFKDSPGAKQTPRPSRKKLNIEPGKSITAADLHNVSDPSESSASSECANTTSAVQHPPSSAIESSDMSDDSIDEWHPEKNLEMFFSI